MSYGKRYENDWTLVTFDHKCEYTLLSNTLTLQIHFSSQVHLQNVYMTFEFQDNKIKITTAKDVAARRFVLPSSTV